MHKGGKEYRRLVAAFERIFGATIFFGTDTSSGRAKVVQRSRFNFFREAQIWYSRDLDQCPLSEQFENVIVLSDEFYREISAHAIPADLEAVKVLAGAPAVLDLFMWLSYRCFLAKGQEAIPLLGPFGLAGQIGSIEYARPRRFREKLDQWLHIIHGLWPECPARISSDGERLIVNRANAVLTEQKIARQGENQKNDPIVTAWRLSRILDETQAAHSKCPVTGVYRGEYRTGPSLLDDWSGHSASPGERTLGREGH
jgi:hypothetical protein